MYIYTYIIYNRIYHYIIYIRYIINIYLVYIIYILYLVYIEIYIYITGREERHRAPTHTPTPTPFSLCTVWPSRGGWPVLGQALELADGAPWDVMTRWAREYGKVYQFPLFGHVNVVLSDPAYMREVMRTKVRGMPVTGGSEVSGACGIEVHSEACTAVRTLNRWSGVLCVAILLLHRLRVLQSYCKGVHS